MTDYTTEEMTMTNKIKILIGDDSAQYRGSVRFLTESNGLFRDNTSQGRTYYL